MTGAPFMVTDLDGTLDPATWTPIVAPVDCDGLLISNANGGAALTLRGTIGLDSVPIPVGSQQSLSPPPPRQNARATAAGVNYRFAKGMIVGYLKPVSGTGTGMFLLWA